MKRSLKKWQRRDPSNPKHAAHYERVAEQKKLDAAARRVGAARRLRAGKRKKPTWDTAKKRRRAARQAKRREVERSSPRTAAETH